MASLKVFFRRGYRKPHAKENFQMWHRTHLRNFLLSSSHLSQMCIQLAVIGQSETRDVIDRSLTGVSW